MYLLHNFESSKLLLLYHPQLSFVDPHLFYCSFCHSFLQVTLSIYTSMWFYSKTCYSCFPSCSQFLTGSNWKILKQNADILEYHWYVFFLMPHSQCKFNTFLCKYMSILSKYKSEMCCIPNITLQNQNNHFPPVLGILFLLVKFIFVLHFKIMKEDNNYVFYCHK